VVDGGGGGGGGAVVGVGVGFTDCRLKRRDASLSLGLTFHTPGRIHAHSIGWVLQQYLVLTAVRTTLRLLFCLLRVWFACGVNDLAASERVGE
jgi:hypothetical protein